MLRPNCNLKQCPWSKCDKGVYKGHHTPIQWEQHKQYAKIDLPPPIFPVQVQEVEYYEEPHALASATPTGNFHYIDNTPTQKSSRFWQYAAVGTMIMVWGLVIWSVTKLI